MARVVAKKMMVGPTEDQLHAQLGETRTKILLGHKKQIHNEIMEFIKEQTFQYGVTDSDPEGTVRPANVGKPIKFIYKSFEEFDPRIAKFRDFCIISQNLDEDQIHSTMVTIYPPPKSSSSHKNMIPAASMMIKDRFIFFANSDEKINYVFQNPDQISSMFGINIPKNMVTEIPEHVVRGYVYHLVQSSAMSLNISYDDLRSFQKQIKNGRGFRTTSFNKALDSRYIIVMDFATNSKDFKKTMKNTVSTISGKVDGLSDEKKALTDKALKAYSEKMKEEVANDNEPDQTSSVIINEDTTIADLESKIISSLPKAEESSNTGNGSSVKVEDVEDDEHYNL